MNQKYKDYYSYRLLEIIPGLLIWATFVGAVIISILSPIIGIYIIIAFDVYWVLRVTYLTIFLVMSWFQYQKARRVSWWPKLQADFSGWSEYYHIIFLPTAGEPLSIVETTFNNLANIVNYDKKKMIVVLAGEERKTEQFAEVTENILAKHESIFYKILITTHPDNIPGEIAGKGSNLFNAGHEAKKYIDAEKIDYKKIIVSTFDIDTITHPDYFAYLTYKFLSHANPYRASFQPMAFYNNNIWKSDVITRIVANSTTFWLLTDLARPARLFTFSSHSMSWQALVDVGFWQNNIVTEDSRIFLQCLIHYDGDYQVEPMHIPVSMNTVYVGTFWRSMKNQYRQMRRWAYGVEHFPYMVWHFRLAKKMPRTKKWIYIWNQTEGVYSWATAPLIILIMGQLPLYVAEKQHLTTVLTQNAPLIMEALMRYGMFGLLIVAFLSVTILPPLPPQKNKYYKFYIYPWMFAQWIIFPVTMIIFGSVPAVDAQTRLMFGKYLGFWVTEKVKE
ncbi:MAG: hypothetical protein C3F02_04550 [Parcubacteria group bacterium]|nr:MAG: hypothetical protein C3F02_04550 [Parcubacteria group bacterium]